MRSAIVGGVLAIVVVVATIFGASLSALVSRPPLYGWNWSYELRSGYSGVSNIPQKSATAVLDRDKSIAASTGVDFASMRLDDLIVPVIGAKPHAPIAPSQLSGHAMEAADQIVLAPGTLAQLHKRVGDSVEVGSGANRKMLTIVGTAAFPAVGILTNLHTELATGAVVAETLIPANNRGFGSHDGPEAIFVRLRLNVEPAAALPTLKSATPPQCRRIRTDGPVSVLAVQRPAEIVNYRTIGTAPALLGIGLAVGAATALGLTLIASVRRRRRDLALLKVLGFTRRQLAAVVIWQASVAAVIGAVAEVPLGIIVGRELLGPVQPRRSMWSRRERARRLDRPRRPRCALPRQPRRRRTRTPSRPHLERRYCSTPTEPRTIGRRRPPTPLSPSKRSRDPARPRAWANAKDVTTV